MAGDGAMGAGERAQMARPHIFVADGDAGFLNLARDILQDAGYNVTTTNLSPATFAQIAAVRPDVLLVGLAVGHRAGWELLERLHATATMQGQPVIVASTQAEYRDRLRAQGARYGADAFLAKPFDLDELLALVRAALAGRGSTTPSGHD